MNVYFKIILLLILSYSHCLSATLEYRVYRLTGDPLSKDELVKSLDWNFLVPVISGSAPITADGSFLDDHISKFLFPTQFTGYYPDTVEEAKIGHIFSGNAKQDGGLYEFNFSFAKNGYLGTTIFKDKSGNVIPRPIVQSSTINSSAACGINQWMIFGGIATPDQKTAPLTYSEILAIRVVEK